MAERMTFLEVSASDPHPTATRMARRTIVVERVLGGLIWAGVGAFGGRTQPLPVAPFEGAGDTPQVEGASAALQGEHGREQALVRRPRVAAAA
jgi:hypothetical protein